MFDIESESKTYQKLIDEYGSRYAAISYVSKKSRNISESTNQFISYSQAISWVLNGVEPKSLDSYKKYLHRRNTAYDDVYDYIYSIQTDDVRLAVTRSLAESRDRGHLIYSLDDIDKKYHTRIRVICNMLWDMIKNIEFNNRV